MEMLVVRYRCDNYYTKFERENNKNIHNVVMQLFTASHVGISCNVSFAMVSSMIFALRISLRQEFASIVFKYHQFILSIA